MANLYTAAANRATTKTMTPKLADGFDEAESTVFWTVFVAFLALGSSLSVPTSMLSSCSRASSECPTSSNASDASIPDSSVGAQVSDFQHTSNVDNNFFTSWMLIEEL